MTHRCHDREFLLNKNLEVSLAERIAGDQMKREGCWTESLAVGSAGFVEKFKPADFSRRETELVEAGGGAWALQESVLPYGQKTGPKNAANALRSTVSGAIHLQSNELLW